MTGSQDPISGKLGTIFGLTGDIDPNGRQIFNGVVMKVVLKITQFSAELWIKSRAIFALRMQQYANVSVLF